MPVPAMQEGAIARGAKLPNFIKLLYVTVMFLANDAIFAHFRKFLRCFPIVRAEGGTRAGGGAAHGDVTPLIIVHLLLYYSAVHMYSVFKNSKTDYLFFANNKYSSGNI